MAYGNWSSEQTKVVWSRTSQYNASSTVYSTTVHWKYRQDNAANKTQIEIIKLVFRQHLVSQGWGMSGSILSYGVGFSDVKTETNQTLSAKEYFTLDCGRQKEFTHDSSGNFSGKIYWKCSVNSSDSHRPTQSSYTSFTPSIPKLTPLSGLTLDKSTVDAGGTIKFTTSNNADQTYKLYYSWYGSGWTLINGNVGASCTWTVPVSFCHSMSSTTSNAIIFKLESYSGSTKIGETTAKATITVPTNLVPSISSVTAVETVKIGADLLTEKFGNYLQGKSRPKITVNAAGSYSSYISSVSIQFEGVTYSGSGITLNTVTGTGARDIKVTVADSRGRTATKTIQITAIAYNDPAISKFQVTRCDASGNATDEGTCVKIVYSFSITSLNNKNSKSLSLQYLNGSTWTNLKTDCAASAYSATDASFISGSLFSVDNSYQYRAVITDSFGTKVVSASTSPSFALINWGSSGKTMAIGQVSSNDGSFEVGVPAKFNKTVNGYRVGRGAPYVNCFAIMGADSGLEIGRYIDFHNASDSIVDYDARIMITGNQALSTEATINGVTITNVNWKAVPYAAGFTTYSGLSALRVRKTNRLVEIRGEISPTKEFANYSEDSVLVGTIPEGFRPDSVVQFLCQGSGTCIFLVRIKSTGQVYIDRYRYTNANGGGFRDPFPSGAMLLIHGTYFI